MTEVDLEIDIIKRVKRRDIIVQKAATAVINTKENVKMN